MARISLCHAGMKYLPVLLIAIVVGAGFTDVGRAYVSNIKERTSADRSAHGASGAHTSLANAPGLGSQASAGSTSAFVRGASEFAAGYGLIKAADGASRMQHTLSRVANAPAQWRSRGLSSADKLRAAVPEFDVHALDAGQADELLRAANKTTKQAAREHAAMTAAADALEQFLTNPRVSMRAELETLGREPSALGLLWDMAKTAAKEDGIAPSEFFDALASQIGARNQYRINERFLRQANSLESVDGWAALILEARDLAAPPTHAGLGSLVDDLGRAVDTQAAVADWFRRLESVPAMADVAATARASFGVERRTAGDIRRLEGAAAELLRRHTVAAKPDQRFMFIPSSSATGAQRLMLSVAPQGSGYRVVGEASTLADHALTDLVNNNVSSLGRKIETTMRVGEDGTLIFDAPDAWAGDLAKAVTVLDADLGPHFRTDATPGRGDRLVVSSHP